MQKLLFSIDNFAEADVKQLFIMDFNAIFKSQKDFFNAQKTKDLSFRKRNLEKLRDLVIQNEYQLNKAIAKDFSKSAFETYLTEITVILKDIEYYLKHLDTLARPKTKTTNLANLPGSSKIYADPLGVVLVIGAWNYPYQLSICPLVAAIATGNCCILKPSELPANTMRVLAKMINGNFDTAFLHVVEGGVEATTALLKQPFDKIFFTGSPKVGRIVYEAAAKNLTPVVLELGGKSPAIVTANANIDIAAKRIVWGKFLNAGQTCVAPDYVVVDENVKDALLQKIKHYIIKTNYRLGAPHYTKIINERNFDRLMSLVDHNKIYLGGVFSKSDLHIAPLVMDNVTWDDAVMQEEIFGPILPILTYSSFQETILDIAQKEKPLAAYLFSNDSKEKEQFLNTISFGGGCINDVIVHFTNENMPFGGVGNSGIGSYHGKFGFDAFTHQKSVVSRATWGEPNVKYPPYSENKKKWIKRIL